MKTKSENQKVRIKSLELKNIKRFEDIKINFDKKVTCIIAENGIGKTTILSSLAIAICGVDSNTIIKNNNYNAYELIREQLMRIRNINIDEIDLRNSKKYSKSGFIELDYEIEDNYKNKINFENTESITGILVNDNQKEETFSFGINTTESGNEFKTLIIGFPQGQVRNKAKDLKFANNKYPNISDVYPLITGAVEDKLYSFTKWINQIYSKDSQNIDNKIIVAIFKIISKIVESNNDSAVTLQSIKFDDNSDPVLIVKTTENPEGISIELLSQGLANVFTWIGHFVKRIFEAYPNTQNVSDVNAILIIDEIDKYLHPKWQKRILKVLLEVFENTQFVITTHSPLILDGLEKGQVAHIKFDGNRKPFVEYNNDFNIWGWEYQDILERWMIKSDPYEYNLNEEEIKLEILIKNKASQKEITILEEKIFKIKESYAGKDPLNQFKKERLQREEELKEKNIALKKIITELRKENKKLKNK